MLHTILERNKYFIKSEYFHISEYYYKFVININIYVIQIVRKKQRFLLFTDYLNKWT